MPKLDDQISTLQQRLAQLQLRQQRIDARKLALATTRNRKADTRRKILLGGLVLEKLQRGEVDRTQIMTWLDQALTRPGDRALFELPVVPGPGSRRCGDDDALSRIGEFDPEPVEFVQDAKVDRVL